MTTLRDEAGDRAPARRPAPSRPRGRHGVTTESRVAIGLGVFAVAVAVGVSVAPDLTPFTSLVIPLVLGSVLLGPRTLPWFVVFDVVLLTFCVSQQEELTPRTIGAAVVLFLVALIVLLTGFRRARLGVAGLRGEAMFGDLCDSILDQGDLPDLPAGWGLDSELLAAGGTRFAGDFVVACQSADDRSAQLVLVDVSGKGVDAGIRALQLAGAFGGLLGSLPRERFLDAANDYVLRQAWDEGFATAVHLWIDLRTGAFEVRTAGHPPPAHRTCDGWRVLDSGGPFLGLVPDPWFDAASGVLRPGECLLLYTDGMVERGSIDIDDGIAELLHEADVELARPGGGAAARLARAGDPGDDRAVVVLRRDAITVG